MNKPIDKLFSMISDGNASQAIKMLESDSSLKNKKSNGVDALWETCNLSLYKTNSEKFKGCIRIMEYLLEQGVNPDSKYKKFGNFPVLMHASSQGLYSLVELLIKKGANVNAVDKYNATSLHRAALMGHSDVVQLLVNSKADKYWKMEDGETPLDWAKAGLADSIKINESDEKIQSFKKVIQILKQKT